MFQNISKEELIKVCKLIQGNNLKIKSLKEEIKEINDDSKDIKKVFLSSNPELDGSFFNDCLKHYERLMNDTEEAEQFVEAISLIEVAFNEQSKARKV